MDLTKVKRLAVQTDKNSRMLASPETEEKIHRFCVIAAFFLTMLILIYPMLISTVSAESLINSIGGKLSKVPNAMAEMIVTPITDRLVEQIKPDATGPIAKMYNWMTTDNATGNSYWTGIFGEDNANNSVIQAVEATMKTVGMGWMLVIAMGHLFSNLEKGMEAQEATYRILIEICIAGVIILNLDKLISLVVQVGQVLVASFDYSGSDSDKEALVDAYLEDMVGKSSGGFIWWVKSVAWLVLPWFLTWVVTIIAYVIMIEVAVELFVRRLLCPLAVADIYQEGLRSPGARFIKKIFALFIKLVAVLLIAALVTALMTQVNNDNVEGNGIAYTLELLALNTVAVISMFKVGSIADEVVGA